MIYFILNIHINNFKSNLLIISLLKNKIFQSTISKIKINSFLYFYYIFIYYY